MLGRDAQREVAGHQSEAPARTLVGIRSLSRPPQLEVLLADERVQLIGQFGGEVGYADEFEHIGKVPKTMWRTDPRSQLELHQSRKGQERGTNATNGRLGRIRKRHGLGPTICAIGSGTADVRVWQIT